MAVKKQQLVFRRLSAIDYNYTSPEGWRIAGFRPASNDSTGAFILIEEIDNE